MTTQKINFVFACFTCCALLAACDKERVTEYDILHIEGVSWASNVTTSYATFGASSESEEKPSVVLPAYDGDLLYMILDDQEFYYRYTAGDGKHLVVTFDTLNAKSVSLNGKLEFMELSDHASWEYLNGLSDPVRKQLSTLYITEALTLENLSVLRQHESSIRGTGLDSYSILTDIELIWIQSYDNPGSEIISSCSNLKSLIIAGWEPHYGDLLPLSKLSTLQTLTLAECGITDFSNIEFPPTLERLQIIDCATLSNITGLKDLRKLRGISFSGCPETEALIILNKKKSLRWLSFPENVSQSEFAAIVSSQTKLEVIELLNCHEIDNISPLKALPDLKILVLALPKEQLLDLGEMNQLELIILQAELFDLDPQWIGDLRSSLPDTQLVPGSGLCLGSGWLLLMLPLMLIFRYKFRHYR